MGWIRENDILKLVDSVSTLNDPHCSIVVKDRASISVNHDAAVRFLHQVEDLINQDGVNITLPATRNGLHPHDVAVFNDLIAICSSDLWDEHCHINLEIAPRIGIVSAEGHEHALLKRLLGGFIDRVEKLVTNAKPKTCGETESEETY